MLEVVSWYLMSFITYILDCYVFSKFINEKFKLSKKLVLLSLIISLINEVVGYYGGLPKIVITNLTAFLLLKIIYNKTTSKTLLGTIFTYIGYVIADCIFAIIFIGILNIDVNYFIEDYIGILFVNIFEFVIYIFIFRIKRFLKFISKTINWYNDNKILNLILTSILVFLICYVILYPIVLSVNFLNYQFLISSILIGIIIFVLGYFNQKSNNNQLTIKYDNLLEYVKDYEVEVVEKGKAIHEHKNQLAVIDGMIPKNNKKLKQYVSENLEKVQELDDNIWLEKLTNLPTGGIKGLVYLKIKKMLENNIVIYVDIDSSLNDKDKWDSINNNLEDYTRILGVYLDNAIEASIESKDKQIILEFIDNEDNIEFILSNTYRGIINLEEMDNEKFSTKGKGRGYGLSLVKDIIDKNKYINQKREINGKFYVQKLYIKK